MSHHDIVNALHENGELSDVLALFEKVKDTTHCSTGCGGCHDKVMAIISDILKGVEGTAKTYHVIENRPSAIRHAMDIAQKDDIIVLAGKGHETYQEICGVKHHLDEREVVAQYLAETRR